MSMTKRRVFLAYCSAKEDIAAAFRKSLQKDFEVVLWQDAEWGGNVLLDNIIGEIESCLYGVAIISCDDELKSKGVSHWVPRDNVALELGIFLGLFGKARTAIISVTEPDGSAPKFPTDLQGWLHLEVKTTSSKDTIKEASDKIRKRFSSKDTELIPSLVSHSASRRGFNVLTMADAREHWGLFEGKFLCLNPSWTME
jgi:Predicted nucleotide-binding protein containing TIR-like domain